jgi:hypothetical protein
MVSFASIEPYNISERKFLVELHYTYSQMPTAQHPHSESLNTTWTEIPCNSVFRFIVNSSITPQASVNKRQRYIEVWLILQKWKNRRFYNYSPFLFHFLLLSQRKKIGEH